MAVARLIGQTFSPLSVPGSLRWFYLSIVLRRMADALLLVIFPVYLYQLGPRLSIPSRLFSTEFEQGIAAVLIVLIMERLAHLLLAQPLAGWLQRLGLKRAMLLGQLARFSILMLYSVTTIWPELVWPAAFLWAFVLGWYFPSYHLYLAEKLEVGKIGRELGTLEILIKLGLVVSPLVGVLFYSVFGSQDAFLLAATITFLSALFLLDLPDSKFRTRWKWSDLRTSLKTSSLRQQWLGIAGKMWEEYGLATFLPLFLFLSYHDLVQPGYIFTSASLFSLIVIYLAGWSFDMAKNTKPALITGASSGFFWIARFFLIPFPLLFVVAETFERFSSSFFSLSFFAQLIRRIRQKNPVLYVHNREVVLDLALIVGAVGLFLLLVVKWSWLIVFLSFMGAALLSLVFVKPVRKR